MRSKTKTAAVGIAAACAASATPSSSTTAAAAPAAAPLSSSSAAAASAATSSWSLSSTPSLLNRIPRGGHSPTASSAESSSETVNNNNVATNNEQGEKKRKKKKKKKSKNTNSTASQPKQQQQQQHDNGTTDEPTKTSNSNTSNNNNSSSSSSSPLPPAAQSILQQSCHYDVLGITKSATSIQIQKAYRRRCVLTHPDKTRGDRSAFDKVSEAYDVLSCDKKRAVYDRFGKEGLEGGVDSSNTNMRGGPFGMGGGTSFFGNDVFRDFFGAASSQQQQQQQQQQSNHNPFFRRAPTTPRNRDLRYQLEVTLEELYNGTTKHVAIQQPNPLRPHFPYRKEVEVQLTPGLVSGQSVRLSGVVDSIHDAAPADVIFLIRERRHPVYTRRGNDLAMEVTISFGESIVGFQRKIQGLDGREIVIRSPFVRRVVRKEELVDVPALPTEDDEWVGGGDGDDASCDASVIANQATVLDNNSTANNATAIDVANNNNITDEDAMKTTSTPRPTTATPTPAAAAAVEQITKTTTLSYHLPPSIIQTGDVHVLKGHGMPKKKHGPTSHHHHHHDHDQYGDLYVQYIVEMPGQTSSSTSSSSKVVNAKNLSPEERVELARLLNKLEGGGSEADPTLNVIHSSGGSSDDGGTAGSKGKESIHHLAMASASDFGRSTESDDHDLHDEHLRHDEDNHQGSHNMPHHGFRATEDVSEFFQRAFNGGSGRSSGGFGGPFGLGGGGGGGGFHYFSSSGSGAGGGAGFGYNGHHGEEEDHKVECNQM
ncbi:hypothetical protein ACHAXR_008971 [Thalassiosira sp. AJA248-18]